MPSDNAHAGLATARFDGTLKAFEQLLQLLQSGKIEGVIDVGSNPTRTRKICELVGFPYGRVVMLTPEVITTDPCHDRPAACLALTLKQFGVARGFAYFLGFSMWYLDADEMEILGEAGRLGCPIYVLSHPVNQLEQTFLLPGTEKVEAVARLFEEKGRVRCTMTVKGNLLPYEHEVPQLLLVGWQQVASGYLALSGIANFPPGTTTTVLYVCGHSAGQLRLPDMSRSLVHGGVGAWSVIDDRRDIAPPTLCGMPVPADFAALIAGRLPRAAWIGVKTAESVTIDRELLSLIELRRAARRGDEKDNILYRNQVIAKCLNEFSDGKNFSNEYKLSLMEACFQYYDQDFYGPGCSEYWPIVGLVVASLLSVGGLMFDVIDWTEVAGGAVLVIGAFAVYLSFPYLQRLCKRVRGFVYFEPTRHYGSHSTICACNADPWCHAQETDFREELRPLWRHALSLPPCVPRHNLHELGFVVPGLRPFVAKQCARTAVVALQVRYPAPLPVYDGDFNFSCPPEAALLFEKFIQPPPAWHAGYEEHGVLTYGEHLGELVGRQRHNAIAIMADAAWFDNQTLPELTKWRKARGIIVDVFVKTDEVLFGKFKPDFTPPKFRHLFNFKPAVNLAFAPFVRFLTHQLAKMWDGSHTFFYRKLQFRLMTLSCVTLEQLDSRYNDMPFALAYGLTGDVDNCDGGRKPAHRTYAVRFIIALAVRNKADLVTEFGEPVFDAFMDFLRSAAILPPRARLAPTGQAASAYVELSNSFPTGSLLTSLVHTILTIKTAQVCLAANAKTGIYLIQGLGDDLGVLANTPMQSSWFTKGFALTGEKVTVTPCVSTLEPEIMQTELVGCQIVPTAMGPRLRPHPARKLARWFLAADPSLTDDLTKKSRLLEKLAADRFVAGSVPVLREIWEMIADWSLETPPDPHKMCASVRLADYDVLTFVTFLTFYGITRTEWDDFKASLPLMFRTGVLDHIVITRVLRKHQYVA